MTTFFNLLISPILLQAPTTDPGGGTMMYVLLIIMGTGAFFLLKGVLSIRSVKEFLHSKKFAKITPIILIISFLPLFNLGVGVTTLATQIDRLRDIRTYTPLLGKSLGGIVDLADQNGLLPTFNRSPEATEMITFAAIVSLSSFIGFVLVIILNGIQLYGIFHIEKFKKNTMKYLFWTSSGIFVIISILEAIGINKVFDYISPYSNDTGILYVIPILTIAILGLIYKYFRVSLEATYIE